MKNKYFYTNNNFGYEPGESFLKIVAKPIRFKGFEKFNFFLHGERYNWRISEMSTGRIFAWGETLESVREQARERLQLAGARIVKQIVLKCLAEQLLCDKRCGRGA